MPESLIDHIRRHTNSAAMPLSTSNALSRIVDEMEGTDG